MSLEMWIIKVHNTYILLEEQDRTTYDGIISFRRGFFPSSPSAFCFTLSHIYACNYIS